MVDLRTCCIKINQMQSNIPYMDGMDFESHIYLPFMYIGQYSDVKKRLGTTWSR